MVANFQILENFMRLIHKIIIWLLFMLRVYELRHIRSIRQGILTLDDGTMYALSPCEVMNYAYLFFYKNTGLISDDSSDSALQEFEETAKLECRDLRTHSLDLYCIFKRRKRTGYLIVRVNSHGQASCHHFYTGYYVGAEIWLFPLPGYYDAECIETVQHAAAHILASDKCHLGEKVKIDLFGDDTKSSVSYTRAKKILRLEMIKLMQECRESEDGLIYKPLRTDDLGFIRNPTNPTIAHNIDRYIQEYDPNR